MAKISIGFSKGKGFAPISWLIKWVEKTHFSHAYITWNADSLNRKMIYEARGAGVRFVGQAMFESHNEITDEFEFEISDEAKIKLVQWAVDNAGKGYGKWQFVGIGIVRFLKIFGINIRNPFNNGDEQYVCTELSGVALVLLGLMHPIDQDMEGPRELYAHVKEISQSQK